MMLSALLAEYLNTTFAWAEGSPEYLTSRSRQPMPAVVSMRVGEEISTKTTERRALRLPDGSSLYVNGNTQVKLDAPRRLSLSSGEIYVDVVPDRSGSAGQFQVKAPKRELATRDARFAVRASSAGTGLIVTRGLLEAGGRPVHAGQELAAEADKPVPTRRSSYVLDWTRDLMTAADAPLVPGSKYAGGALIAVDPNGQEAKLGLRDYHIDVHIEDGFARTTIDQTFFNHMPDRLEGTFHFPLPPDASLSRLAMYVDGTRREGGMAERIEAQRIYDTILYRQKDPALLEWVDGSTFRMRVFPLEGREEKRIILSYTQKLHSLYGRTEYRFPSAHGLSLGRDWSSTVRMKNGAGTQWNSPSHALTAATEGADLVLKGAEKDTVEKDVILQLDEKEKDERQEEPARFSSANHEGAKYLMLRYRPQLTGQAPPARRDWVFLFESSGDRNPLLARAQIDVIQGLLANAEPDDTFAVLSAGTRTRSFSPAPLPVSPENIRDAVQFLERSHLIGALDLGAALADCERLLRAGVNPYLVHVGSGIAAMGERRDDVLAKRIPDGVHYVGIGVGKRWARSFMKAAAERTDGYFTQINPDESIAWRTFDLAATLQTPRLLRVQVADNTGKLSFLNHGSSLAEGEELCAIARLDADQKALPESVVVTGTLAGKPFRRVLPVKDVSERADYLPRTWAKLEIDRLLAEDSAKNRERIVALSKSMYVMSPYTSLVVLENDEMYEQFKVDRGRKDHWALYPCPDKIPLVYEPLPGQSAQPRRLQASNAPLSATQLLQTILVRVPPRLLNEPRETAVDNRGSVTGGQFVSQQFRPFGFIQDPLPNRPASISSSIESATFATHSRNDLKIVGNEAVGIRAVRRSTRFASPDLLAGEWEPAARTSREEVLAQSIFDSASTLGQSGTGSLVFGIGTDASPRTIRRKLNHPFELAAVPSAERNLSRLHFFADDSGSMGFSGHGIMFPRVRGQAGGTPDVQEQAAEIGPSNLRQRVADLLGLNFSIYSAPSPRTDERPFYDLLSYAPGLNTSEADLQAVLEAEAPPNPNDIPGHTDPGARDLIAKARAVGWRVLTAPKNGAGPDYTILFDGTGRCLYERILPFGLRERFICDGKTLLHLYPDLGLAARRPLSRFHLLELSDLLPWIVPPPDQLARGVDVKITGDNMVALMPSSAKLPKDRLGKLLPYRYERLVFAPDGPPAERQIVQGPDDKILYRECYAPDGTIKMLDGNGKELAVRKGTLKPATAPDLKADTDKLVVLSMPFRTPDQVRKSPQIERTSYENLRYEDALALFAAQVAANDGNDAFNLFRQAFYQRNFRKLGFYVLLAAAGHDVDSESADVLAEHLDEPAARYLAVYASPVLRRHASQWAARNRQWGDSFFGRLALAHALSQRLQDNRRPLRPSERDEALAFVRDNSSNSLGWWLLALLSERAGKDKELHRALAETWQLLANISGQEYAARYESARSLWRAGERQEARKQFLELYQKTLSRGLLPAIDHDFRQALLGDGKAPDEWSTLLQQTAARLLKQKRRLAILTLAWQCWRLEDSPWAERLSAMAFEGSDREIGNDAMKLVGLGYLMQTNQWTHADQLLRKLLADPKLAKNGALWRLAAQLAEQRDMTARELACLERALEAEYRNLPEIINVETVRQDYKKLLEHYERLADAMEVLEVQPRADFRGKVVRAADRWRALDPEFPTPSELAARILQRLGERELAWDYLTTPVALNPHESQPWLSVAQSLVRQGNLDLSDRAFKAACEAEPTNAEILWNRAQNLKQAGKHAQAQKLLRQVADGPWPPRFQWLQTQARTQLKGE
jgi:predicted Zn-dependent protease